MSKYIKYTTKTPCLSEVKVWSEGESKYLHDLIGVSFNKHLFVCEDGNVSFFYDHDEWKKFNRKLKKVLTNRFFDQICRDYMILVGKSNSAFSKKEINDIAVKLWAILAIFNEIDESPQIASEYVLDKLLRIRTETHTKYYELKNKMRKSRNEPKDYIYFKGELYIKE